VNEASHQIMNVTVMSTDSAATQQPVLHLAVIIFTLGKLQAKSATRQKQASLPGPLLFCAYFEKSRNKPEFKRLTNT
jgi:hypothetical protein